MVGKLKIWLLVGALPILSFVFSSDTISKPQNPLIKSHPRSGSNVEEYAVYSAFINQKYIQPDSRSGFNLKGKIIEGFGPEKVEEVVILPKTLWTLDYYIPQAKLREMLPFEAQPAFSDYLRNNDQPYPLISNFKLKVAYNFFSKDDGNSESPVVNDSKARLRPFVARHPNALGYLALSRVGFTSDHKVAVVAFAQTDFNIRSGSSKMWGGLALLRKAGGIWRVQDVYSNNTVQKPLTIDLTQCTAESAHLAWGLGSAHVSVKGRRGSGCVFEHMSEIEGGYTRSECLIPISMGTLTIYEGNTDFYYSHNVSRSCKVIKSGNLMFQGLKPPG